MMDTGMALTRRLERTATPTLLMRFARLEAGTVLRRLARALGMNRPVPLTLADLPIPDSQLARAATALVEQCEPAFLLHHSMRSYLFGAAVGRHLRLAHEPEVLYLAAIMHDLGLVAPHDGAGAFELNGARAARGFLLEQGAPEGLADRVHEAVALHSAVGIAARGSCEMALLHFGAGIDVIGYRAEDVAAATREAICEAWPRLAFKRQFTALLEDQVARKPDCHIAGHMRLGFARKLARAPFAE